jgi:hypothetical protein
MLASCDGTIGGAVCDDPVTRQMAEWRATRVVTQEQLQAEIDELLPDNSCRGIKPADIRKVLHDMEHLHR